MIKTVVFDIDGILTDNTITVDSEGREHKRINFKDLDAVNEIKRRGYTIIAVTGEQTPMSDYFKNRLPWDRFYSGIKDKKSKLMEIESEIGVSRPEICYIGEGKYDVEAIGYAGLGVCPTDAIPEVTAAADVVLKRRGGDGCVWELVGVLEQHDSKADKDNVGKGTDISADSGFLTDRIKEHTDVFKKMLEDESLKSEIMRVADRISDVLKSDGTLFLCGNGGSAADAQHIATEFVSRFYKERPAMRAEALTVNTSSLTAISNDYEYNRVFARQLEAKGRRGDILIGISTSGKSANVIEAFKCAKDKGIYTVLLTGSADVRTVEGFCDHIIGVPSSDTPRIQEAHIFIGHMWAEYAEEKLFG